VQSPHSPCQHDEDDTHHDSSSSLTLPRGRVLIGDDELAVARVDIDLGAIKDVATEQGPADAGLDFVGDEAPKRSGPVHRIEALLGDEPDDVPVRPLITPRVAPSMALSASRLPSA